MNIINIADHRPPAPSHGEKYAATMFDFMLRRYAQATGLSGIDSDGGWTEGFLRWASTQRRPTA